MDPDESDHDPESEAPPQKGRSERRSLSLVIGNPLRWSVERWFLAVAIPIGLFFAFAIPPTQGIDESAHFLRAWLVSDGDLVARTRVDANTDQPHAGGVFDTCVIDYVSKFQARAAEPDDFEPNDYWFDTPDCSPREQAWFIADAASNYAPAAYAPQSLTMAVTRGVGLPVPVSFFAGRLAGLAAFIAITWYAIRIAPGGKAVLMVVALLPTSIMSAATFNADGLADALAFFAVAATASIALSDELDRRRLALLIAAIALLGVVKQPYLAFALLPLLIPNRLFGRTHIAVATKVAIGGVVAACSLGWLLVGTPDVPPAVFRADVDHGRQLKHIVRHPFDFLATVARTIAAAGPQSYTLRGVVGSFGMGRYVGRANDVVAPILTVVFAAGLAAAAHGRDNGVLRSGLTRMRSVVAGVGPLLIAAAGVLAVYASMYLIWAPVGADYVTDVQGRYFIPLLAVPSLALVLRREPTEPPRPVGWIVAGSVALLAFAVGKSFLVFY